MKLKLSYYLKIDMTELQRKIRPQGRGRVGCSAVVPYTKTQVRFLGMVRGLKKLYLGLPTPLPFGKSKKKIIEKNLKPLK